MHFIAPGGRNGTTLISHHLHLRQLVAQDQPTFLFSILKVHALESKGSIMIMRIVRVLLTIENFIHCIDLVNDPMTISNN